MLLAAQGLRNDEIAARLDTLRQIVSKWRKGFYEHRLVGLADLPRGGRPPGFPPAVVVAVKALACELPRHGTVTDAVVELLKETRVAPGEAAAADYRSADAA